MRRRSYLTCPHKNVQQFTECCLDCGWNVYTSDDEYRARLKEELEDKLKRGGVPKDIADMEDALGIKR